MKRKQLSLGRHFSVSISLAGAKGCRIIFVLNMQSNFLDGVPFNLLHEIRIQQCSATPTACQASGIAPSPLFSFLTNFPLKSLLSCFRTNGVFFYCMENGEWLLGMGVYVGACVYCSSRDCRAASSFPSKLSKPNLCTSPWPPIACNLLCRCELETKHCISGTGTAAEEHPA